jgi:D-alanyl-D-alanine carboxypeptidase
MELGIAVVSLTGDSLVFAHHALQPMVPASNQKLLVTAAAWSRWDGELIRRLRYRLGRSARPRVTRTRTSRSARRPRQGSDDGDSPDTSAFSPDSALRGDGTRLYFPGYDLLCRIHRWSDNRVASRLLDCLAELSGCARQEVVQRYLDSTRVWSGGLNVLDGSGRSPGNRVAALCLVQALRGMYRARATGDSLADDGPGDFARSLAQAGGDGTLRRHSFELGGRVMAKTGSIGGTYSLSGYLLGRKDTMAFSLLLNRCYDKNAAFEFFGNFLRQLAL